MLRAPGGGVPLPDMAASEVRPATPADAEAVEDHHHRCFTTTYAAQVRAGEFGPPDRAGVRQQIAGWYERVLLERLP